MIAPRRHNGKTFFITDLPQFASCRDPWNSLAGDRVFHSWEWMFAWWETWQAQGELCIVVVTDAEDRWVGVAPWYQSRSTGRGLVVRNLGSGAACSDYVGIAVRPGFESTVAGELAELIAGDDLPDRFASVDLFEFEGHREDEPVMARLREEIAASGNASVRCEEFAGTWRSRLPESWEQYETLLHKSFRRKTRKAGKRLASDAFHGQVFRSPAELERIWPVFVDLHQRRRTSLGQPGCFADPQFEAFLKTATLRLAATSAAQINLVTLDDVPLTANLEFVSGDSVYMYQTGMDPEQLALEPGHITFTWAIKESIRRKYTYFDFLRGDEPYKSRWKSQRVPLFRTRVVPDRLTANLRNSLCLTGKQVRGWARNVINAIQKQD